MKNFQFLGRNLSKNEQKQIVGGLEEVPPADGGSGGCCAYVSPECGDCGGFHRTCGYSRAEAIAEATRLAIIMRDNGFPHVHGRWCCASC